MSRLLHRRRSGVVRACFAVMLIALCIRVLAPAGYMFSAEPGGRFLNISLCSTQLGLDHAAPVTRLDLTTGEILDSAPQSGRNAPQDPGRDAPSPDAPCIFASLAVLAAPEPPASVPAAVRHGAVDAQVESVRALHPGLAAPPPWATGPPRAHV